MDFLLRRTPMVVLALGLLASRANAVAPEVHDEGKFFSAEAIKKANRQIREIMRKYEHDLLVETFPAVPGEQSSRVRAMKPEDRAKFFQNWARDRMDATVVNGVYILLCKDPAYLELRFTDRVRYAFDKEEAAKLKELLLERLKAKKYDEALLDTVEFVRTRFAKAK